MFKKLFRKGILALTVSSVMGLSTHTLANVVISVVGPYIGASTSFGERYWRGTSQTTEGINMADGISNEKIRPAKTGDACKPKQAMTATNRLMGQDRVVAVADHFCSSSATPASGVYDETGIIAITPGSTDPQITRRRLSGMLRMRGRDDQQGVVTGDYIVKVLKTEEVTVIHGGDIYDQGLVDATRTQLNKLDVKETLYEGLTRDERDLDALVTKVRTSSTEAIHFGGLRPEAGPLVRQIREQGPTARLMSDNGMVTDEPATATGGPQYVKDVLVTFGADPRLIPDGKAVMKKFRVGGFGSKDRTPYSCASIQSLAVVFNGIGANGPVKAAKWLKPCLVQTVMSKREWDGKGDLKVSSYVVHEWDGKGKYHQLLWSRLTAMYRVQAQRIGKSGSCRSAHLYLLPQCGFTENVYVWSVWNPAIRDRFSSTRPLSSAGVSVPYKGRRDSP